MKFDEYIASLLKDHPVIGTDEERPEGFDRKSVHKDLTDKGYVGQYLKDAIKELESLWQNDQFEKFKKRYKELMDAAPMASDGSLEQNDENYGKKA